MSALRDMWGSGGLGAFFPTGGVSIQMLRDIPYAIVTLMVYEGLREHWINARSYDGGKPPPWKEMVAGGISGGTGSFVTNPMDVVKTRLQTDAAMYGGSVLQCARATYAEGGLKAFLRGSVPRLLHKVPANASFFLLYEVFRRLLRVGEDGESVGVKVKSGSAGGGGGEGEGAGEKRNT